MHTHTVHSFVDFVKQIDVFDLLVHQVIFRGQSVQGNLLPGIARASPATDTTASERKTLEHLKIYGASHLPNHLETDLDLLVRAQHFGLQTRLLDWTSNSLAALWFACVDRAEGEVFVYALEVDDLMLPQTIYAKIPFETAKTRAFLPRLNNPRVLAQHGWFTLHRYSKKSKRFVSLEKNPDTPLQHAGVYAPQGLTRPGVTAYQSPTTLSVARQTLESCPPCACPASTLVDRVNLHGKRLTVGSSPIFSPCDSKAYEFGPYQIARKTRSPLDARIRQLI